MNAEGTKQLETEGLDKTRLGVTLRLTAETLGKEIVEIKRLLVGCMDVLLAGEDFLVSDMVAMLQEEKNAAAFREELPEPPELADDPAEQMVDEIVELLKQTDSAFLSGLLIGLQKDALDKQYAGRSKEEIGSEIIDDVVEQVQEAVPVG